MGKRFFSVSLLAATAICFLVTAAYAGNYQDQFRKPEVLWIAGPGPAETIRNSMPVNITFFNTGFSDLELHHLTDKPLEEEKTVCDALTERNKKYLEGLIEGLKSYDVLVLSVHPQNFDAALQSKIVSWVKDGGRLIYYTPSWEIIFKPENPLTEIMPVKSGDYKFKAWNTGQLGATSHPLIRGLPIEFIGNHFYGPIYEPADERCEALTIEKSGNPQPYEKIARFWWRKVGSKGGQVVFFPGGPFAQKHQWGAGSYASYEPERPDDREVWKAFFKRMLYSMTHGEKAFPVLVEVKTDGKSPVEAKQEIEINVDVENMLADKPQEAEVELIVSLPRIGILHKLSMPAVLKNGEKTSLSFKLQLPETLPADYIVLTAVSKTKGGGSVISRSWTCLPVKPPLEIIIDSGKPGFVSGESIPAKVQFGKSVPGNLLPKAFLADRLGNILQHVSMDKSLSGEPEIWNFAFSMPKDLSGSKYAYWITVCVFDKEKPVAIKRLQIYNDDPWDMRKQFQFSLWAGGRSGDEIMKLTQDAGFNSLGYGGNPYWAERYGWRRYDEGTGIDTFGVCIDHDNWNDVEKAMNKTIESLNKGSISSRSLALVSLGEESGFKGGWGTRYYWEQDQAPAIPQKVFDDYLKMLYKDNISDLNFSWGSDYRSFSDIPLSKKYSVGPRLIAITGQNYSGDTKEKEWKLDVDVANISPDQKFIAKTAPYFETYGFYDWYYQKYCDLATDVFRKSRNPSARTIMSAPGGFYPKVDVYNFDGIGPFHAKERGLAEAGMARVEYGDVPGFSGALWAYFDLYRQWRSEIFSYMAVGNTHIDYWVDFPLTFNYDNSHTRSSFWTKRFMEKVKTLEPVLLHKRVSYTPGLAIFTGKQLIPRGLGNNFFGGGVSPNTEIYSALEESGYLPRFTRADDLKDVKVLICSYAQLVTAGEAAKLKEFVEKGGLLIATPWLASSSEHKNLLSVYPAEETGLDKLLGFKLLHTSQQLKKLPLKIEGSESIPVAAESAGFEIQSFGQDKIIDMAEDVKVLATHQDKSPAILERQFGKGKIIYFNFVYCWDGWWNTFYLPQREGFRRLVKAILEKDGRVKNDYFIGYQSHDPKPEKGWWGTNGLDKLATWKAGDAVPYWATTSYTDPSGGNKYIFVFSDHRAPKINANLAISEKDSTVFDIYNGRKLERNQDGMIPLSLESGDGTILAIVKNPPQKLTLKVPAEIKAGSELAVEAVLQGKTSGMADYGITLKTIGPDGKTDESLSLNNWTVSKGGGTLRLPVPFNQKPGAYRIIANEPATGLSAEQQFKITEGAAVPVSRELVQPFLPEQGNAAVPPMTDKEFIQELAKLRAIYTTHYTGLDSKYHLDYFLYVPFIKNTRHHVMSALSRQKWPDYVEAVGHALRKGEVFYLTGEDLGLDPASGIAIDCNLPDRSDFLKRLGALKDAKSAKVKIGERELTIVSIGSGKLVYDPVSLQNLYMSEDFVSWQKSWLENIK